MKSAFLPALLCGLASLAPHGAGQSTQRSNLATDGREGNGARQRGFVGVGGDADGLAGTISDDGRWVAFESEATNLIPGDTNGLADIFLRDLVGGQTLRISVHVSGAEADDDCYAPWISADGRAVAFSSAATNLVGADGNDAEDVFLHDRLSGGLARASVDSSGGESDDASEAHAISPDGRFIAFESSASNLVRGDANAEVDVFVRDRLCAGAIAAYAQGCPAASGRIPHLDAAGCPAPGEWLRVSLFRGVPASAALFLLGAQRAAIPLGSGCELLVAAPLMSPLPVSLTDDHAHLPLVVPPGTRGADLTIQALVFDPAHPLRFCTSEGLEVAIR